MSLMSSLIPINMGLFELEIPLGRILEPPHPQFSQLSLSIELYKYKLISIVEGGTIEVMLCCWIDHLAQAIREHREKSWSLCG